MSACHEVYRVKLNPLDDAHVESFTGVKMLTADEANALRELIKDQIGKTVGSVGIEGEQYDIYSRCPNIYDIHAFISGVKSKQVSFKTYFDAKEKQKLEKRTTTYQCSPAMATCDGLYGPHL